MVTRSFTLWRDPFLVDYPHTKRTRHVAYVRRCILCARRIVFRSDRADREQLGASLLQRLCRNRADGAWTGDLALPVPDQRGAWSLRSAFRSRHRRRAPMVSAAPRRSIACAARVWSARAGGMDRQPLARQRRHGRLQLRVPGGPMVLRASPDTRPRQPARTARVQQLAPPPRRADERWPLGWTREPPAQRFYRGVGAGLRPVGADEGR